MIAFCFLTYDEIVNYPIWETYFSEVDPSEYLLLCNPKVCNKIVHQPIFYNKIIRNRVINTEWGKFSLLVAQNELFRSALEEPSVRFIVLVSHNSIPVQPFAQFKAYLHECNSSIISRNIIPLHGNRYFSINRPIFPQGEFYSMSQWHVLQRRDAEFLVRDFITIKEIFGAMIIPDEHVYINYLLHYRKCTDIKFSDICHVSWRQSSRNRTNEKSVGVFERGVEIFTALSDDFLYKIIKENKFFLRKITAHARINPKYLLEARGLQGTQGTRAITEIKGTKAIKAITEIKEEEEEINFILLNKDRPILQYK